MPQAAHERAAPGAPGVPVPAARGGGGSAGSGLVRGHHLHPGAGWLSVSAGAVLTQAARPVPTGARRSRAGFVGTPVAALPAPDESGNPAASGRTAREATAEVGRPRSLARKTGAGSTSSERTSARSARPDFGQSANRRLLATRTHAQARTSLPASPERERLENSNTTEHAPAERPIHGHPLRQLAAHARRAHRPRPIAPLPVVCGFTAWSGRRRRHSPTMASNPALGLQAGMETPKHPALSALNADETFTPAAA